MFDVSCGIHYILQAVNARPADIDRIQYMEQDDYSKNINAQDECDWHQRRRFDNHGISHWLSTFGKV